jgi:hypothetical protein
VSTRFWILAALLVVLVAALWRASKVSERPPVLRSEHSEPAKNLPAQQVAITPGGKQFHDPHCRYIHGRAVMIDPNIAAAEGYTPDPRCMKQAMQDR